MSCTAFPRYGSVSCGEVDELIDDEETEAV
jgi:hypothetical protein